MNYCFVLFQKEKFKERYPSFRNILNSPALEVGHTTSGIKGKANLVLFGDVLPPPRPQVLQQTPLPHELRDQEDLALHSAPLPLLDHEAQQSYEVLVLQGPLRMLNQLQKLPVIERNTHVMTFASPRKFWAAADESLISSFTATFCPL